jgi:hypothetical protein
MNPIRTLLGIVGALGLVACGGPNQQGGGDADVGDDTSGGCSDIDGDGYGVGSDCAGPDCNESVPDIHTDEQCADFCAQSDNMAPGCACSDPEPAICYFGTDGTLGVGSCRAGLMTCDNGLWSECTGQVLPGTEVCDGADNNCDGATDEGVLSACGDCNLDCTQDCIGVGCDDGFDPSADGASGVVLTPDGGITLDGETGVRNYVIWIANSSEGTVSRINTRTREEEGRYRTGPGAFGSDSPSRTTVNYKGDVVVANRGMIGEASRFNAEDCVDQDGNGRIDTSTGPGDVYDYMEDECWMWSTPVGSGARGSGFEIRLGLDGVVEEYVWVGSTGISAIKEIEADTGELTGREIDGVYPYGLAIGPDDKLWTFNGFGGGGSGLVEVTTTDDDLVKTVHPYPVGIGQYGLTVDSQGRVWVTGSGIGRYDPSSDEWETPAGATGMAGGIAVDGDDNAWTGEHSSMGWGAQGPWKIDGDTLEVTEIEDDVGGHGWAVDFDGYIWCVPFVGARAYVIDPDTLSEDGTVEGLIGAYTYSDMTGFQLANATNPVGIYPMVFDSGCDQSTNWASLDWDAVVPDGTSLTIAVKTADDLVALAAATSVQVAVIPPDEGPIDLGQILDDNGITPGRLLYVETTLRSFTREGAPILNSVSVDHSCDFIVQ